MIESGRKPLALQNYDDLVRQSQKEFTDEILAGRIFRRLLKRELQYKLLGESAPELDQCRKSGHPPTANVVKFARQSCFAGFLGDLVRTVY